jgi:uncharacterized protein (TIGR02391 family)
MAHIDFRRFLPEDEDVAAAMPPQELAAPLLAALRGAREPIKPNDALKLPDGMYPKRRRDVLLSLGEAFAYLQRECLLVPYPPELHGFADKERRFYKVARDGEALELPAGLEAYRHSRILPKELLHRRVLGTVLPLFLRRDLGTAVFSAMKEVEVAVRAAAGLHPGLVGVSLVRKAFAADQPLGSGFAIDSERQAMSDLFAGAMGYFRNATGHRSVDFEAPEAARVILFASQLLYLLEQRQAELHGVQSRDP